MNANKLVESFNRDELESIIRFGKQRIIDLDVEEIVTDPKRGTLARQIFDQGVDAAERYSMNLSGTSSVTVTFLQTQLGIDKEVAQALYTRMV